ncbi:hypothetical protein EJB05_43749, partial [Eragrostis curvula]
MAGLSTGAPIVQVYHEKSRILPDVSRVLACLYEKDIQFKTHTTSYKSLLKLQASTHAPVPFYDGPKFLEESREICRYIAEKYEHHGYPFLLGKDALERASVEQWLHNEEHAFNPPSRALFCHLAFPPDKDDDDDINMHTRKLEEVLEVYEQRLSDSEYLAGNNFTLADLVHLPNSHYITASKDFLYLYDSRKNVRRWWDLISTRNSWQEVLMHMKRVEDQNKQEELKEQQLKRRDPKRTPGYPLRIYSRKQTTTEPQTIQMHPIGSMSSSPIAPPTEKHLPTDIPDEAIVSSSQSSPTDHKTSAAQSKETPFQEKPPKKPPIPLQSTIAPATSPTIKDALSPEPTKTDPPTRRKPSLSKDVSNKLHVFDYYEARSHTEEDTYIEPTPRKASETLNTFSGSSTSTGHTKASSILAKEEPEQHSKSDFYKSDITATGVDSQDKDLVPYSERTPQSDRPTDAAASKLSTNDVHHKLQVERWHAATAGLGNLKEDADHIMPVQQVKSSKDVQQHTSQDSEQAASPPVPQESVSMVQGQGKISRRPYADQKRDVSSPLPQQAGEVRGITEDDKAPPGQSSPLLPPSTQKHAATPSSRKEAAKEEHSKSPPQAGHRGGEDEETKISDSLLTSAKPMYTQRSALPPRRQDQVPHAQEKGMQSGVMSPEPQKVVERDAEDTHGERTTGTPEKQYWEPQQVIPQPRPAAAEDAVGEPGETIQFPDILDTTKKSRGAFEETKGRGSTLHRARPLGPQDDPESRTPAADERKDVSTQLQSDAKDSFQQSKLPATNQKGLGSLSSQKRDAKDLDATMSEEKAVPSEWLKEVMKSQSKAPKAHPADSQGSNKVEKTPFVYQKKPLFTGDSQEQAQIIPSGQKGDSAVPEHKEASYAPYTFDEKLSATSPTRENSHDEFSAEKSHKKDNTDDQKVVPPIRRKEPTSQVQPSFGRSQGAAPRGDLSSKLDQWQSASAPLNDVTISSGGDEMGMPTIHQKLTPMSRQGRRSAQDANQMAKESSEKRVEPIEPETSGVQRTSPSVPGVSSAHHATTDERVEQPIQMQAPTPDAHSASGPTKRATPDGHDIVGESKLVSTPDGQISEATKARRDPATFNEDVHHANLAAHGVDKNTFRETKVADSTPPGAKPMYTQQSAPTPSRHPEVEDAGDRGRSSKTIPDRQKMLERKTVTFGEQYSDPLKEVHPSRWKESESTTPTADQLKDLGSLSLDGKGADQKKMESLSSEGKDAEAIMPEEKIFSTERLREALKETESTTSKAQPSDYQGTIKVEKTSSIYQKRPLVAEDSREHPQIITAGEKVDGSTLKHQQASNAPYTSDEKSSALSPARAVIPAEESYRKDTTDDQKVVPPLLSQEQTSEVQSPSKPSQDADPNGDLSSKPSTIAQWQRASAPLKGASTDNEHAAPSLPEAATADHAITDDTLSDDSPGKPKQMQAPITDARPTSVPTKRKAPNGHETGDLEPAGSYGGQMSDAMKATPDPATISEDSHDADIVEKTTTYDVNGVQLAAGSLLEQARRPAPTHEARELIGSPTSKKRQLGGSLPAEVAHIERKSTPSDRKPHRAAQPLSPVEPVNIESKDSAPDYTIVQQVQSRPSAPITRGVPALDSLHVTRDIQEVAPDNLHTHDSGKADVPSQEEQISHTSQSITRREDMTSAPNARDSPKSVAQLPSAQVHEVTPDESSERQGSHVGFAFRPDELGPAEKAFPPSGSVHSSEEPSSAEPRKEQPVFPTTEQIKTLPTVIGQQRTPETREIPTLKEPTSSAQAPPLHVVHDSLQTGITPDDAHGNAQSMKPSDQDSVYSEEPSPPMVPRNQVIGDSAPEKQQISSMKGDTAASAPDQAKDLQTTLGRTLPPVWSVSPSSDTQLPSGKGHKDVPANDLGEAKPSESRPSDIPHSSQKTQSDAPADDLGEAGFKPSAPVPEVRPRTVVPASAPVIQHGGIRDEVLDKEKLVPSGQDSVHSAQPRNAYIGDSAPSTQQISSTRPRKGDAAASSPDQAKDSATLLGRQDIFPPIRSVSPSSDTQRPSNKGHEDEPVDGSGESKPIIKASAPGTQDDTATTEGGPDKRKFAPSEPTSSTEPKSEDIRDAAPSTQLISTTEARKGNATIAASDQDKDTPTILDQQGIRSAPVKSASPYYDTKHRSQDAPDNDLGEAVSEPSASVPKVGPPTGVSASAPATQHGVSRDKALDKPKFVPSGQDSVHSTQLRNRDIEDSASSAQQISSTPDQAKDSQTTHGRQGILSPERSAAPSSDTQRPLNKVRDDVPFEGSREAKPIVQASVPGTQDDTAATEAAPDEKKFMPSEPTSSTEPRSEDIRDAAPSTRLISSTEARKGDAIIASPVQDKDKPTILAQQGVRSTPVKLASPYFETNRPSQDARDDAPDNDLGEAAFEPSAPVPKVGPPTVVPASAPATQYGSARDEAIDKTKFVPSGQDSVHSTQPRNREIEDSAPLAQQISSTRPRKSDSTSAAPDQSKDSQTTHGRQDILSPVRSTSPSSDTQHSSNKVDEDVPTGKDKPIVQAPAPSTQDDTATTEAASDENKFVPSEPTSLSEPRSEDIRDAAPSTQLISSTEARKGDAIVATPLQDKDTPTILDQQGVRSAPVRSASPYSDTKRPSQDAREDAPDNDLGEAASEPSAPVPEVRPPRVVPASAAASGSARDEALDKPKFVTSGQDSIHSTQPRSGGIEDSAPLAQQMSSTRPRKGDSTSSAPDQAKDSQTAHGRQDILSPVRSASPSDTQRPLNKVDEDVPVGEAKPVVQAPAPSMQDDTGTTEAAPDEKKFVPPEPTSSSEPRSEDIRDAAPSAQLISSTEATKGYAIISAPVQDKDTPTILDQQGVLFAPVKSASPYSDTKSPSQDAPEDAPDNDLGEAASEPSTPVPASGPATQHGSARDEALDKTKFVPSGQDSVHSRQLRNGEIDDSDPSKQQISTTRPRNGDDASSAPDDAKDSQTTLGRQDMLPPTRLVTPSSDTQRSSSKGHEDMPANDLGEGKSIVQASAVDTAKAPLPGTQDASTKAQGSTSDDIDTDESIPREGQVSPGRHDSHRREGHATKPYKTTVDEKKTTSPSSKAYGSESGSDLKQARNETYFPEHGIQKQPPSATQDISLDASSKAKSSGQGAKVPIASVSETQLDAAQPQDEPAPVEKNFAISDQSAHASKSPSAAEPRNGETYVGPAEQMNARQTIVGNQAAGQTPDPREALTKHQEPTRDDDNIGNLGNPLVTQEQASHHERASEGPTSEVRSALFDKTALPPSQEQSSDTRPDSTPINGGAHLSSAGVPATSTLQNQEVQPLAATQTPTTPALQGSASSRNVHADSSENMETPREPSNNDMSSVTSSAVHSDSLKGEPGATPVQPEEASFNSPGDEKTSTIQGYQKVEETSKQENPKAKQQIDQSNTESQDNKELNEELRLNLPSTFGEVQKQPSWESEDQQQAGQASAQSPEGTIKQVEQSQTRGIETDYPEEREPQENTNQTNRRASQVRALDSSGKQASGVQLLGENTKNAPNSTDDAPNDIQTLRNSEDNLRSYEESNVQQQPEGKAQGGLPENSYLNKSSQSQAEASGKSSEQFSPGIQNKNKSSSRLDDPTDSTKSGDTEDTSQ